MGSPCSAIVLGWRLILVLLLLPAHICPAAPPRFVARLADGTRVEGDDLSNWHRPEQSPRLDDRPLMELGRPAVWLQDRRLRPAGDLPAFVEMVSGDCLPGTVTDHYWEGENAVVKTGDYWVVRPAFAMHPPRPVESPRIRVRADFVRRVVWQRGGAQGYEPATAFLRDGRRFSFRTARIRSGEVLLLQADGIRRLTFDELAELHLPEVDFWPSAVLELAILSPELQTRLIQFETDDGLLATGSFDRFAAFAWGSERISEQWSHGIQPAWSLDLLWVPRARIRVCRMFLPHQLPLSRIPMTRLQASDVSPRVFWPEQRDRNVLGGVLRSDGRDFGWGWGVHAPSRLTFRLPPEPSQLRCNFGLDHFAGRGGSVRARVQIGSSDYQTLYESSVRTGSDTVLEIGPLPLPADEKLHLEVDPAHAERPPGADPFSIRDLADWLDPLLEVDTDAWHRRIQEQTVRQFPAWDGWSVRSEGQLAWPSGMRESHVDFGSFVRCVDVRGQPLVLSRSQELAAGRNYLLLAVSRSGAREATSTLQISLNDAILDQREIPYRDNWQVEVAPLVFPLTDSDFLQKAPVALEIRQSPTSGTVPVFWEGILVTDRLPMVRALLPDHGELHAMDGGPVPAWVADPRYSSAESIAFVSGSSGGWRLDSPVSIRQRPEWGEFRFLHFAVRKTGGGRIGLELRHTESENRTARYDAGVGEPCWPAAKRVWDRALGDQWVLISRDVHADFGQLDIEELIFTVPDGQTAYIDHVYATRSGSDVRYLPTREPQPK
jgi:hypothetical protein